MALGIKSTPNKVEIGDILTATQATKIYSDSKMTTLVRTAQVGNQIGTVKEFTAKTSSSEGYISINNVYPNPPATLFFISDIIGLSNKANPAYDYPPVITPSPSQTPSGSGTSWGEVIKNGLLAVFSIFSAKSTTANATDTNGDGTIDEKDTPPPTPETVEKTALQKSIPFVGGAIVLGVIGYFVFRVKKPKVAEQAVQPPVGLGKSLRRKL